MSSNKNDFLKIMIFCVMILTIFGAHANTVVLPNCKVDVELFALAKKLDKQVADEAVEVYTATQGTGTQSVWCGPGVAATASDMRDLMGFISENKKLRNVNSRVAKISDDWIFLAEAESMASDGVTATYFEYQCHAISKIKYILCLVSSDRKQSFSRDRADQFFSSIRSNQMFKPEVEVKKELRDLKKIQNKPETEKDFGELAAVLDTQWRQESKDFGRDQRWGSCVTPMLGRIQDNFNPDRNIISISKLNEYSTKIGLVYILLAKRRVSSYNTTFECELSYSGEYIGGKIR